MFPSADRGVDSACLEMKIEESTPPDDATNSVHHTAGRRLSPEVRERQIVLKAVDCCATHGFSDGTRDLARQLGGTQPQKTDHGPRSAHSGTDGGLLSGSGWFHREPRIKPQKFSRQ